MIQWVLTALIVAAAVFFAVRGLVRTLRGKGGCRCSGCPHGGGQCHCCDHQPQLPDIEL